MSANTKIEWCDHTWSPVWGCTEVSKAETGGGGCDNCYARVLANRFGTGWNGAPMREFGEHHWNEPLRWNRRAAAAGTSPRVFPSMCDPFDKNWPPGVRTRFFELIERTPNLIWLLLTKRIGNVTRMLEEQGLSSLPSNVWLGATIVNQAEADRDIPKLLAVPAAKRFLSMEPLLGPVALKSDWLDGMYQGEPYSDSLGGQHHKIIHGSRLDWVIVGGESGPGARPMHPDWARSLRDQCQAAGVAFLFKQWGEWAPAGPITPCADFAGGAYFDSPSGGRTGVGVLRPDSINFRKLADEQVMERIGKKAAGRLLDGRTWDGVPT